MMEIVTDYLEEIMDTAWMGPDSKLMLLGGIMINLDEGPDLFEPKMFEVRDKDGTVTDLSSWFT